MSDPTARDDATLAWYDETAAAYAARSRNDRSPALHRFLGRLPPGATILELGCGGGQDAAAMIDQGFEVTPTDGSEAMAREAEARLGRPVAVMRFDELAATDAFDAVWAHACLLHVPEPALVGVLARVHRALKSGGLFQASYKAGTGEDRDALGRYYNFPSKERLAAVYEVAAPWAALEITASAGSGYDRVERTWLSVFAQRAT